MGGEHSPPSLLQAQSAAQRLNIPFGYLYYSEPPDISLPLPDLRTVGNERVLEPSPELAAVVNDALDKQEWYREYLESIEAEPLDFIASFSTDTEASEIADVVREKFGINSEMRRRVSSWEQFLTEFVRVCDREGVLVLRSGIVGSNTHRPLDVQEFRGFAISDEFAPIIFVNSRDAKAAQVFTLAHELAHLWLGKSGVSRPDFGKSGHDQSNTLERLCNRVAAEILVPSEDLVPRWRQDVGVDANVQRLVSTYRVSRFVLLRQAYDLGLVRSKEYWAIFESYLEDRRPSTSGAGGDFFTNALARNSTRLTTVVLSSVADGRTTYTEAARLLNVRTATLAALADHLARGAA